MKQRVLGTGNAAQECDAVLKHAREPSRPRPGIFANLGDVRARKIARGLEPGTLEPQMNTRFRAVLAAPGEPIQIEPCVLERAFPLDAQLPVLDGRRSDPRLLGQIRDVDEPLTIARVAVCRCVVAQPDAGELIDAAVGPRDAKRVGAR